MYKRRILFALLVLCLLLPVAVTAESDFTGDGTAASPYLIENKEDLVLLATRVNAGAAYSGEYFKLTADINLNNQLWTPIGNGSAKFSGHFDGADHTISNLVVNGGDYVGLFGFTTGGSVRNLNVHNAKISGRVGVGVIAGSPYTSQYHNIKLTGLIQVDGMSYVGGMLGRNLYANASNLTIDAAPGSYVNADSIENGTAYRTYIGGVIGFMGEGSIKVENVRSNIDVYGNVTDVGGIVGIIHYGNIFKNITCSGDVHYLSYENPDAGDEYETGGIAGTWMNHEDGKVTMEDLSFTGKIHMPEGMDTVFHDGLLGRRYYKNSGLFDATLDGKALDDDKTGTSQTPPAAPYVTALNGTVCTSVTQPMSFVLKNVEFAEVAASASVYKLPSERLVATFEASSADSRYVSFSSGSVKVTLKPEFLRTLEDGEYVLVIDDHKNVGDAGEGILFEVRWGEGAGVPRTGDDSTLLLWAMLMALSTAAVIVIARKVRFN